jgi:predicted dithiol-disulfide oxidoreductase (DUF899 family)
MEKLKADLPMNTPPVASLQEWEAARQQLLAKEKALTRARDLLAAERRRMPWVAVEKKYEFQGPRGKASLFDLFEGRRQLIVYRAFFEPGVYGWPEHACRGCSFVAERRTCRTTFSRLSRTALSIRSPGCVFARSTAGRISASSDLLNR